MLVVWACDFDCMVVKECEEKDCWANVYWNSDLCTWS